MTVSQLMTAVAIHWEWLGRLVRFGAPAWKVDDVLWQCLALENGLEWALLEEECFKLLSQGE